MSCLRFSPDGALLFAGTAHGVVHVLDGANLSTRAVLRGPPLDIAHLVYLETHRTVLPRPRPCDGSLHAVPIGAMMLLLVNDHWDMTA